MLRVGEDRHEVLNLRDLMDRILAQTSGFLRLELEDNRLIIVDVKAAKEARERIVERYRLPSLASNDLQHEVNDVM